MYVILYYVLLI